jgi:hypothetical protein
MMLRRHLLSGEPLEDREVYATWASRVEMGMAGADFRYDARAPNS